MIDITKLDAAVAKFRLASPNIARAFDEVRVILLAQDREIAALRAKVAGAAPPANATLNQIGTATRKLG